MRTLRLDTPLLVLVGATRGMIGFGAGLLIAERLRRDRRKSVGWTLLAIGALSTIPLGVKIFRNRDADRRRAAMTTD